MRFSKRWLMLTGALMVALGIFVLYWFQPQKLIIEDRVNEAPPSAGTPAPMSSAFRSLEHETTGRAVLLTDETGRRFVRFEDFKTSNGPDLVVSLANAPSASSSWTVWGDDYVQLGKLKGNMGAQNYEIPQDVDLAKYSNVVIWCDRFDVGFGVASL